MPRYAVGDRVRVLELNKPGHIRTPHYIRHRTGTVIQFCGAFLNPEDLAVGNTGGPVVACYRVEFPQREIWPDYAGSPEDSLVIEIYEHWMEPATEKDAAHA
ncbi:SH3-like domain-containing protein [Methylobacterium sp. sgz302541]|uniref:SH3-like domain-containing protein n=1 Tax=unclassified Methylobacterium TaxID=2615210 RepID=UPI003D34667D